MTTRIRTALAATITAALMIVVPGTAALAATPAAELSVTLTSSEKSVDSGDKITYTGQVDNLGTEDLTVRIELNAPAYVELADTPDAEVHKNTATWSPTIAAGKDAEFTIEASIGTIPKSERRVTTLAAVYVGEDTTPIVRTADARFINGVDDVPGGDAVSSEAQPAVSPLPWIVGLAVLIAAAVATAVIIARRRRGASTVSAAAEPEDLGTETVDK